MSLNRLPPIAKLAHRLLADIENAVRRFPRYHKYAVGAELRAQAMLVARSVHKAWRDADSRTDRVAELCAAIDDLKITLQLAKEVGAFGSFAEFEANARLVGELGQQSGGWKRKLHVTGQNAGTPSTQRASILSSQIALGANP